MSVSTIRWFLVVLLVFSFLPQLSFSQKDSHALVLERTIRDVKLKEANVDLALARLSVGYGIRIGLEMAKDSSDGPEIVLELKDATVRQILDSIIKQDTRYEWAIVDNVINVKPRSDREELLADLLNTKIRSFSVQRHTATFDLRVRLLDLPEVQTRLRDAGVRRRVSGYFNADLLSMGDNLSLTLHDKTLKEILNTLVSTRTSDARYWVINRFRTDNDYVTLNFVVFQEAISLEKSPALTQP